MVEINVTEDQMKLNFRYLLLLGALGALENLTLIAAEGRAGAGGGGAAAPTGREQRAAAEINRIARGRQGRQAAAARRAEVAAARAEAGAAGAGAQRNVCEGIAFAGLAPFSLHRNGDAAQPLNSQRAIQALDCALQQIQAANGVPLMDADNVDAAGNPTPSDAAIDAIFALAYVRNNEADLRQLLSLEPGYREGNGAVTDLINAATALPWMNPAGLQPLTAYEAQLTGGTLDIAAAAADITDEARAALEAQNSARFILRAVLTALPQNQHAAIDRQIGLAVAAAGRGNVNAAVERRRAERQAEIAAAEEARAAALREARGGLEDVGGAAGADRRRAARAILADLAAAALAAGNQNEHDRLNGILGAGDLVAMEQEVQLARDRREAAAAAAEAQRLDAEAARQGGAAVNIQRIVRGRQGRGRAEAARLAAEAERARIAAEEAARAAAADAAQRAEAERLAAEAERARIAAEEAERLAAAEEAGGAAAAQRGAGNQDANLLAAVEAGNLAQVQAALTAGANVNAQQAGGLQLTALHLAAKQGNEALVRALLRAGADRNARSSRGVTPLEMLSKLPERRAHLTAAELALHDNKSSPAYQQITNIGKLLSGRLAA